MPIGVAYSAGATASPVVKRLVSEWISGIGLDPLKYATHSMRRTKATLIYRWTGNLWAVQLLLGHTKIESTVRYEKSTSELPGQSCRALSRIRQGKVGQ